MFIERNRGFIQAHRQSICDRNHDPIEKQILALPDWLGFLNNIEPGSEPVGLAVEGRSRVDGQTL